MTAARVYLDLTHLGRHVTGIERIAIDLFERAPFAGAEIVPVRSDNVASMVFKQQIILPLLALVKPSAQFVFPGFPPSPAFALLPKRTHLYVHDTFLLTRTEDLSFKARFYMRPSFAIAVRRLRNFFVNSEKTAAELQPFIAADANVTPYRPPVKNPFGLSANARASNAQRGQQLKLVSLGTVEPRKNYQAAVQILHALRASTHPGAELHIIGREGWGAAADAVRGQPGVIVHGYLPKDEVKHILESADVYLCTSHDEGLGLPLLEAQFAGLPIVAPDQPVFREVLAASGTYIQPADAANSAETIAMLLTKPNWRASAAKAAISNVQRWNKVSEKDQRAVLSLFADHADTDSESTSAVAL
jgi:glycosyltransferase involved in cell wall biosynthesis